MKNNVLRKGRPINNKNFSADNLKICIGSQVDQTINLASGKFSNNFSFQQPDQKTVMVEQSKTTSELKFLLGI